jgi:hypothetical protein
LLLVAVECAVVHGSGGGGGLLAAARGAVERAAVACASAGPGAVPAAQVALLACLRRGASAVQQRQSKSRRRGGDDDRAGAGDGDDGPRDRDGLGQWAATCLGSLAALTPRQQRGALASAAPVTSAAGGTAGRVRVSAGALALVEQLCALDSPGGASLPVLGTSVGTIGAVLCAAIFVVVSAEDEMCGGGTGTGTPPARGSKRTHDGAVRRGHGHGGGDEGNGEALTAVLVENALRAGGRALTACAGSKELQRHAHVLAVAVVDLLAQGRGRTSAGAAAGLVSARARELLLPGVFALFDRCRQRQKQQMFNAVHAQSRAMLAELHGTYLRDYKFIGQ